MTGHWTPAENIQPFILLAIFQWVNDELFLVYSSKKIDPINDCHRHEISFVFANVVMKSSSHTEKCIAKNNGEMSKEICILLFNTYNFRHLIREVNLNSALNY